MLTSLNFLNIGQQWPPDDHDVRQFLSTVSKNKKLFEGEHEKVFDEWIRLLREDQQVTLEFVLNFNKRFSTLWADFLFGDMPSITVDEADQTAVDTMLQDCNFWDRMYEAALDVSRFGCSVLSVSTDKANAISAAYPGNWFPVVDPFNSKKILYHVFAVTSTIGKNEYLDVMIHEPGRITQRQYRIDESSIVSQTKDDSYTDTNIDDFSVQPVHNLLTTDRVFGIDDYTDLDSIIQEMEVRLGQISRILDKHAEPITYAPESAFRQDPTTGKWELKSMDGKTVIIDNKDDVPPGYVVWDAQLEAAFKELEVLKDYLMIVSETCSELFQDDKSGTAESGSAIKRRLMLPLKKVGRLRNHFDGKIKKCIKLAYQLLTGKELKSIKLAWKDGLPRDITEETANAVAQVNAKLISEETAMKNLHNFDDEELQAELQKIADETKRNMENIPGAPGSGGGPKVTLPPFGNG